MEDVQLVYEPFAPESLQGFISDNLNGHNFARTGVATWHPVGFFLKDSRGEWLGGVVGHLWGGWLHVKNLWVTELLRGQGQGTRLMDTAESYAVERGCTHATLETFSFQAPGFYADRGYEVFGTLENYPPGHSKYFLRKRLAKD